MASQIDMLHSLGFYITAKRMEGATQADFEAVSDYHDYLRDVEAKAAAGAGFGGFTPDNPLLPIDDITLTQIQYGDAITQMFVGRLNHLQLTLPYPPPVAVAAPVRERSYFANYLATLGKDGDPRTKADVESVIDRMNELLSRREANEQRVNGLVVGRVQSGKTRNYIGLMLKAVDEGWNVVIVLTSANTLLRDQTQGRIEEEFTKSDANSGVFLNFRSGKGRDVTRPNSVLDSANGTFYWGVVMKQRTNLERVLEWLHSLRDDVIRKMRILIVDDEADNATPDSNAGRNTQLSESEIDEIIDTLREDEEDYTNLASWMVDIQEQIVEKQAEVEQDPGCKTADYIEELKRKLNAGGFSNDARLNEILSDSNMRDLLELHEYQDESGNLINVPEEIRRCFGGGRVIATNVFFKFLRTLLDIALNRSAINARICELIDRAPGSDADDYAFNFERMAYIAYTATPYANILNERPGQTPLYADFIKSLTTAPQYFGLDKIFGREYDLEPVIPPNMNIVDEIGPDDHRFALCPIQEIKDKGVKKVLKVKIDEDLRLTCEDPEYEGTWLSLKRAIAWAFCTAGARRHFRLQALADVESLTVEKRIKLTQKLDYRWTTLMLNISAKMNSHFTIRDYIADYIRAKCATPQIRRAFLDECRLMWEDMTAQFTKDMFDAAFNSDPSDRYGEIADYPYWGDIENDVVYFLDGWDDNRVHTAVINSKGSAPAGGTELTPREQANRYNQVEPFENSLRDDHLWIVIGGNTIGRGLTLTGLTVSYFDRVRKSVAVDTLTQMGRWFGYRKDYELLPRVFMTEETVREMKRTAFIEGAMHENMKVNFDEGYSPSDPEHYQKIYSWGRKLSGRARAQSSFSGRIGALATTNVVSAKRNDIESVYEITKDFVTSLGQQSLCPKPYYKYGDIPLWLNVDKKAIKSYIADIMPHSPEEARLSLRAMLREIDSTVPRGDDDIRWNVVIGEPARLKNSYPIGVGRNIHAGNPISAKIEDGVISYSSVRSDMAFFAMVETGCLNIADATLLHEGVKDVVSIIERKAKANGGAMPAVIAKALEPYVGRNLEERLHALADDVSSHPEKEVPRSLVDCLGESVGNRSAIVYRETVYDVAGIRNPIMQIYLVTPPDDIDAGGKPIITHAFYWPNHSPDDMSLVSIGMDPESHGITQAQFYDSVSEIIRQNGFPMPVTKLKEAVIDELDCTATYFDQNIANPGDGAKYAKFPDKRAYYHIDWASDPVEKVHRFVLDKAAEILRSMQAPQTCAMDELATRVVDENRKLSGLFNPKSTKELNSVFAMENLPSLGLGRAGTSIFVR